MQEAPSTGISARSPAVALALSFVREVEAGRDATALLTPDATEEEMPNRVFASGAQRDVTAMAAGLERGKALFRRQSYEVRSAMGDRDHAALEVDWTGELAVPVGPLAAGATMRARCAFFFEVRDGRIATIRHYDCFDPF